VQGNPSRNSVVFAGLVVGLVIALALISSVFVSQQVTSSSSSMSNSLTASAAETQSAPSADPLLDVLGPMLYHETCATAYPNGTSTTCASTTSQVGVPQTFNMTNGLPLSNRVVYENLFALRLSQNATLQFTIRGVVPGQQVGSFKVYFDAVTGANLTDPRSLETSDQALLVRESPDGGFPTDRYSGEISAQPGIYVFDFQAFNGDGAPTYFLLRDETLLQRGIEVSVGSPQIEFGSFSGSACGGGPGITGPVYEQFPITITSNTTADINLTSPDVPYGVWAKFIPSQLENVGPKGATAPRGDRRTCSPQRLE
jgi:hypothetical protein